MKKFIFIIILVLIANVTFSQSKNKKTTKKTDSSKKIKIVKTKKTNPDSEIHVNNKEPLVQYNDIPTDETLLEDNQVYTAVEIMPEPPRGIILFREKFISDLKKLEIQVKTDAEIVGRFVIEKDGSITDIKILKETPKDQGLGSEYIKVMKNSQKWKPGVMNGKNVRVYYTLAIKIDL
jgi:periplasmic protein TonB